MTDRKPSRHRFTLSVIGYALRLYHRPAEIKLPEPLALRHDMPPQTGEVLLVHPHGLGPLTDRLEGALGAYFP